jgi:hypothetical protein
VIRCDQQWKLDQTRRRHGLIRLEMKELTAAEILNRDRNIAIMGLDQRLDDTPQLSIRIALPRLL